MFSRTYDINIKEIPSTEGVLVFDVWENSLKGLFSLTAGSPFFIGFFDSFSIPKSSKEQLKEELITKVISGRQSRRGYLCVFISQQNAESIPKSSLASDYDGMFKEGITPLMIFSLPCKPKSARVSPYRPILWISPGGNTLFLILLIYSINGYKNTPDLVKIGRTMMLCAPGDHNIAKATLNKFLIIGAIPHPALTNGTYCVAVTLFLDFNS